MALPATLIDYLDTAESIQPVFLIDLVFNYDESSSKTLVRYCTDNQSITYDGNTYVPYALDVKDMFSEINALENTTDLTFPDPNDVETPGTLKTILDSLDLRGRTKININAVLRDEIPSGGGAKFYEDTQYTIPIVSGVITSGTPSEAITSIKITSLSSVFNVNVPKVFYSYNCPYVCGDDNCRGVGRRSSTVPESKTYTAVVNGNTATISDAGGDYTATNYWEQGMMVILEDDYQGARVGVTSCTKVSTGTYDLVLDRTFQGSSFIVDVNMYPNCTRDLTDCTDRFDNAQNYGGYKTAVRTVGGQSVTRRYTV